MQVAITLLCLFWSNLAMSQIEARLKVGIVAPLSGPMAVYGSSFLQGIDLALAEFDQANPGKLPFITLIKRDSAALEKKTEEEGLTLLKQEKVDLIIGELTNTNTYALAKVAQEYQKPLISPFGTSRAISKASSYIFTSTYGENLQGQAMAVYATRTLNAKEGLVIMDKDSTFSQALGKAFQGKFQAEGRPTPRTVSIWGDKPDLDAVAQAVKSNPTDVVYLPLPLPLSRTLIDTLRQSGFRGAVMGSDLWDNPHVHTQLNVEQHGPLIYTSRFSPTANDAVTKKFMAMFQARFQKAPDYWAAMGYDGMTLALAAFKQAGSSRNVALAKALGSLVNLPTLGGPTTMGPDGQVVKPLMLLSPARSGVKFVGTLNL